MYIGRVSATPPDQFAARLIAQGSRFARIASRATGSSRPLVAMRVLATLQFDGPQRIGQLAAHERFTQPAMTATINRLEADGLVTRTTDPSDARAVVVTLTEAGLAEMTAFRAKAAAHVLPAMERLGADDLAVLARAADLLEKLADDCLPASPRRVGAAPTPSKESDDH